MIGQQLTLSAEKWPWTMNVKEEEWTFDPIDGEEGNPDSIPEADAVDANGTPITTNYIADVLINCEILLPHGESE